jgi:DNA ligase 1
MIRALIAERTDPVLFALSYDYVGDLSETVALMWPAPPNGAAERARRPVSEVVETLRHARQGELPASARALARRARRDRPLGAAQAGHRRRCASASRRGSPRRRSPRSAARTSTRSRRSGTGLAPPYAELFAWLEGRAEKPETTDPAPFRPPMLSHAARGCDLERSIPPTSPPNGNGTASACRRSAARRRATGGVRGSIRAPATTSPRAFPDLVEALDFDGALDGELLVGATGRVESFNDLQQRLNRKSVTPKLIAEYPAFIRAYDCCRRRRGPARPALRERRARLEAFVARTRIRARPLAAGPFADWDELAAARRSGRARAPRCRRGRGRDAQAPRRALSARPAEGAVVQVEARSAHVDAVLMYAQRGHGKRSSFYSDYTFGVWREGEGRRRAGAGRQGLFRLHRRGAEADRPLRAQQHGRPLRPGARGGARPGRGWCWRSPSRAAALDAHKSGVAMRFPRISRLRWDKPPREALSTTLMQPSCLSRKVLYISGPSASVGTVWVMTKDGSICPPRCGAAGRRSSG